MNAPRKRRGSAALPSALAALAVSAALTAALAELAATEVVLTSQRISTASALAAADACLAKVAAAVSTGWDFGATLAGGDGVAGTPDDGVLASLPECTATTMAAPGPVLPARLLLVVAGRARRGERRLEAVLGRAADPGVGALVWLADARTLGPLDGTLVLDGVDAGDPTGPEQAALAAPGDPTALDAWQAAQQAHLVARTATRPSVTASAPPVAELAARLRAAGAGGAEILIASGMPTPALGFVDGDLVLGAPVRGAGILFVSGVLQVGAPIEFAGVIVAAAGVRVAPGAHLGLAGALWVGTPAAGQAALGIEGALSVTHSCAAVAAADALLPLPRRAIPLGLHDLG